MQCTTSAGLTKLTLNGDDVDTGCSAVAALCGLAGLQHLELHCDAVSLASDFAAETRKLSRLVALTRIDVEHVPDDSMKEISQMCTALRALPNLQCLNISDEASSEADEPCKIVALPNLLELSICTNSYKMAASVAGLRGCSQLTNLHLGGVGVLAIVSRAATSLPQLLELHLREDAVDERALARDAAAFAERLPKCQALTIISIEADGMSDLSVAAIRAALDLLPALRGANLPGQFIPGALLALSRSCS